MRVLIRALPSSGSSWIAYNLGQAKEQICIPGLNWMLLPPPELLPFGDIVLKQNITRRYSFHQTADAFRPDKIVLIARNLDDVRKSWETKSYAGRFGGRRWKLREYEKYLSHSSDWFDEVIEYALYQPLPVMRTWADVVYYNFEHCPWCRTHFNGFGQKGWGMGNIHDMPIYSYHLYKETFDGSARGDTGQDGIEEASGQAIA